MGEPGSEIREVLDNFSEEQWTSLNKRLTYFFYSHYREEPPLLECPDLVNRALLEAYEGRRRWDPERVCLVTFLCGAMRSIASHILTGRDRHPSQPIEETAEPDLIKKENAYAYHQLCRKLREAAGGDPLVAEIVELFIRDPARLTPSRLRALMKDTPEKDVKNACRRFNNLIRRWREERDDDQEAA